MNGFKRTHQHAKISTNSATINPDTIADMIMVLALGVISDLTDIASQNDDHYRQEVIRISLDVEY